MSTKTIPTANFLKKAASVASYYGFVPIETTLKKQSGVTCNKKAEPDIPKAHDCFSEEMSSLLERSHPLNISKIEQPLQLYHVRTENSKGAQSGGKASVRFGLTVFGIEKSVAEALILRSALAILDEVGVAEARVHINSVGDRDSMQRFVRELNNYFRKNLADMPAICREALKRDVFDARTFLLEKNHPLLENAPRPMQFLTDASRRHLKEVLEFLELSQIPYELDGELVGARDYYSQTVFEIREPVSDEGGETAPISVHARGGRCDELLRRSLRAELPGVSIVIEKPTESTRSISWKPPRVRRPHIYFIQLGSRAKLLSLSVTETLRKAHIPMEQSIGSDSLSEQLDAARELGIPQAIIMGQREVLDGTVIIRDLETHAQKVILLDDLSEHLKSIDV